MTAYPAVMSEQGTLRLVCDGCSIARYGDGEFNLCRGGACKSQGPDSQLSERLREILIYSGECLVGIPNIRSETPKTAFWGQYKSVSGLLIDRPYVSSFISRPDSAPWINTPEFWTALESLWRGQDVTIVHGGRHGLTKDDLVGAGTVTEIVSPQQDAWTGYQALLERIGTPTRAILCLGPTATVMAVDLCAKGVHAIDLGHAGLFLRKHRAGQPMIVTDEDKAA